MRLNKTQKQILERIALRNDEALAHLLKDMPDIWLAKIVRDILGDAMKDDAAPVPVRPAKAKKR